MSQRESGSEVKMPVAYEDAEEFAVRYDLTPFERSDLVKTIADIQRRTLLAAAQHIRFLDKHGAVEELERLAASLGEPGK